MPSRPFGVAILIAGCDHHGPKLFNADPAGSFTEVSICNNLSRRI